MGESGRSIDGSARRRPGRKPAASRDAALALAKQRYLKGERVDVQAIARELGLGRVTMHRWFQTRERLLGEAIGEISEERLLRIRSQTRRRGPAGLLAVFDRFNKDIAATDGLRILLEQDNERALRMLTSGAGLVQPRIVATVQRLIDEEVAAGRFEPVIDAGFLAYGIVRLGEAFLYNDTIIGVRGDTGNLREIEAVLLGLRPGAGAGSGSGAGSGADSSSGARKHAPRLSRGARSRL
ncbi:MAG TPA: QsdR family transcriptional regulator [Solirubrobacteraceae bacterium]